jgi:uncharacterized protein
VKEIRDRLLAFLRDHKVLTLAVNDAGNQPYAAALFYVVDDELRFYVLTDPGTRHGQAMLVQPAVAGTVQRDRQEWREIQGVQFRGQGRQLAADDRSRAWELYVAQYSFLLSGNAKLTAALAKTAMWCIEPEWMRLIDNRLGFGHKEEWTRARS